MVIGHWSFIGQKSEVNGDWSLNWILFYYSSDEQSRVCGLSDHKEDDIEDMIVRDDQLFAKDGMSPYKDDPYRDVGNPQDDIDEYKMTVDQQIRRLLSGDTGPFSTFAPSKTNNPD